MKRPRGRWAKWYASVLIDKRHYPDAEFRAFASLIARAADVGPIWRTRQEVVDFLDAAVVGSTGAELVAFLIAQDDLHVRRGGTVELMGFAELHRQPVDATAADRQRRHRQAVKDAAAVTVVHDDTPPLVPSPTHDRHGVTSISDSPSLVASPGSNGTARAAEEPPLDVDAWATVRSTLDELTGRPISIANPYSRLAELALAMVKDFGMDRTLATFRRVAAAADHPDATAIVLPANRMLRPIQPTKALEDAERQAERERQAARTREHSQRRAREYAEWVADDDAPAQDTPRSVGAILHRPSSAGH